MCIRDRPPLPSEPLLPVAATTACRPPTGTFSDFIASQLTRQRSGPQCNTRTLRAPTSDTNSDTSRTEDITQTRDGPNGGPGHHPAPVSPSAAATMWPVPTGQVPMSQGSTAAPRSPMSREALEGRRGRRRAPFACHPSSGSTPCSTGRSDGGRSHRPARCCWSRTMRRRSRGHWEPRLSVWV